MEINNKTQIILSPQQEAALQQLLPIARIATSGAVAGLPVRPRSHTLLIGPSGSGKSFMARELARRLNLPLLLINVSSWVVLSAKNEPWTASTICDWLDSLGSGGGILAFDEIDKLQSESDWKSYIRLEVHDFLDSVIPHAARMPAQPVDDSWGCATNAELQTRAMLTARLRNRVFVLGCGAWQSAWTSNSREIGFEDEASNPEKPSRFQVLDSISPEIRQRFRDDVCWLEPMRADEYETVSSQIAEALTNPGMRKAWNQLAQPAIARAVAGGLGMRIFEELMLLVLLEVPENPVHERMKIHSPDLLV
jgi:hypothetical protein